MTRRKVLIALALPVLLFVIAAGAAACVLGAPAYDGPVSDHFDGHRFYNPWPHEERGAGDLLKWMLNRDLGPWQEQQDAPHGKPPPERVGGGAVRATFVNHATVLVQMDGFNVLTDPIWSDRASPVSWAGPERVRPPGIRFEDLPPIHAVVVSHNHYDHMDLPTLARLAERFRPVFLVGLGNAAILERAGIENVVELDWWQERSLDGGLEITSVPVRHFSNRALHDRDRTLWTGWVLEGPAGKVYFAGDTGYGPHFGEARERLGPFRLALIPIGAFKPIWFMSPVHLSPDEAVKAHEDLGAATSLAIHFGTFPLGDDGQHEAVRELADALGRARIPRSEFWVLGFGEGRDVPPIP